MYSLLVRTFYAGITLAALVTRMVPYLRRHLMLYGKLDDNRQHKRQTSHPLWRWVTETRVPKSYFMHFYTSGFLLTTAWIVAHGLDATNWTFLLSLWLHLLRRWYECAFVHRFNPASRILLGHYVLGMLFYAFTSSVWLDAQVAEEWSWIFWIVFVAASHQQYRCHLILASLRPDHRHSTKEDGKKRRRDTMNPYAMRDGYGMPEDGWWFKRITAPHYFFEIILYLNWWAIWHQSNLSMTLCLIWVIVNLSLLADENWQWYRRRFPQTIGNRRRLLPYIW